MLESPAPRGAAPHCSPIASSRAFAKSNVWGFGSSWVDTCCNHPVSCLTRLSTASATCMGCVAIPRSASSLRQLGPITRAAVTGSRAHPGASHAIHGVLGHHGIERRHLEETGLVTFNGPSLVSDFAEYPEMADHFILVQRVIQVAGQLAQIEPPEVRHISPEVWGSGAGAPRGGQHEPWL
jgi:hypothetical protein